MCIDCLGHLESWEEFKQKCIRSNNCIQEYLNQSKDDEFNSMSDTQTKIEDEQDTDKYHNYCDNICNDDLNDQNSNNDDLSKSNVPVSIAVCKFLLVLIS